MFSSWTYGEFMCLNPDFVFVRAYQNQIYCALTSLVTQPGGWNLMAANLSAMSLLTCFVFLDVMLHQWRTPGHSAANPQPAYPAAGVIKSVGVSSGRSLGIAAPLQCSPSDNPLWSRSVGLPGHSDESSSAKKWCVGSFPIALNCGRQPLNVTHATVDC